MAIRDLLSIGRGNVPVSRGANPIVTLQDEMNRLFSDFLGDFSTPSWFRPGRETMFAVSPAMDVTENDNQFTITAELPGMSASDVQITYAEGYVTIRGEKKEEEKEEREGYFRQERSYGSFQRVVALPDAANFEKAEANIRNGVLWLTVPKKAGAQAKERRIEIKQAA